LFHVFNDAQDIKNTKLASLFLKFMIKMFKKYILKHVKAFLKEFK